VASSKVRSTGVVTTSFALALKRPPGSSAPAPETGSATAVAFCIDAAGMPTGTGAKDFTITRAVISAASPPRSGSAPKASTPSRANPAVTTVATSAAVGAASGIVAATLVDLADAAPASSVTTATAAAPGSPAVVTVTALADTGRNLLPLASLGLALVAAGSGLITGGRRRTPPLAWSRRSDPSGRHAGG
jgi:hypothetical protein